MSELPNPGNSKFGTCERCRKCAVYPADAFRCRFCGGRLVESHVSPLLANNSAGVDRVHLRQRRKK